MGHTNIQIFFCERRLIGFAEALNTSHPKTRPEVPTSSTESTETIESDTDVASVSGERVDEANKDLQAIAERVEKRTGKLDYMTPEQIVTELQNRVLGAFRLKANKSAKYDGTTINHIAGTNEFVLSNLDPDIAQKIFDYARAHGLEPQGEQGTDITVTITGFREGIGFVNEHPDAFIDICEPTTVVSSIQHRFNTLSNGYYKDISIQPVPNSHYTHYFLQRSSDVPDDVWTTLRQYATQHGLNPTDVDNGITITIEKWDRVKDGFTGPDWNRIDSSTKNPAAVEEEESEEPENEGAKGIEGEKNFVSTVGISEDGGGAVDPENLNNNAALVKAAEAAIKETSDRIISRMNRESNYAVHQAQIRTETGWLGHLSRGITGSDPYQIEINESKRVVGVMRNAMKMLEDARGENEILAKVDKLNMVRRLLGMRQLNADFSDSDVNPTGEKMGQVGDHYDVEQAAISTTRDVVVDTSLTLGTMGGAALARSGARVAAGQAMKQGVVQGIKQGATQGAVYGATFGAASSTVKNTEAVQDNRKGVGEAVGDFGLDAAKGAAAGAVVGGGVGGLSNVLGRFAQLFRRTPTQGAVPPPLPSAPTSAVPPVPPSAPTSAVPPPLPSAPTSAVPPVPPSAPTSAVPPPPPVAPKGAVPPVPPSAPTNAVPPPPPVAPTNAVPPPPPVAPKGAVPPPPPVAPKGAVPPPPPVAPKGAVPPVPPSAPTNAVPPVPPSAPTSAVPPVSPPPPQSPNVGPQVSSPVPKAAPTATPPPVAPRPSAAVPPQRPSAAPRRAQSRSGAERAQAQPQMARGERIVQLQRSIERRQQWLRELHNNANKVREQVKFLEGIAKNNPSPNSPAHQYLKQLPKLREELNIRMQQATRYKKQISDAYAEMARIQGAVPPPPPNAPTSAVPPPLPKTSWWTGLRNRWNARNAPAAKQAPKAAPSAPAIDPDKIRIDFRYRNGRVERISIGDLEQALAKGQITIPQARQVISRLRGRYHQNPDVLARARQLSDFVDGIPPPPPPPTRTVAFPGARPSSNAQATSAAPNTSPQAPSSTPSQPASTGTTGTTAI
jgi:hypothetical protein